MFNAAESYQNEIYSQMTPLMKWNEFIRLREMAWHLKTASVRQQHPEWTEVEVDDEVKRIFLYAVT